MRPAPLKSSCANWARRVSGSGSGSTQANRSNEMATCSAQPYKPRHASATRANDGQILATQVVRDLTAGKGLNWSPAPNVNAKGIEDPIPVFSLNLN